MSSPTQASDPRGAGGAPVASLADREARNPYLRFLLHLGAPLGLSVLAHVAMLVATLLVTIEVGAPSPVEDVQYDAGIVEDLDLSSGFSFDVSEQLDAPLEDLESLDDLSLADIAPTDLQVEDIAPPDEPSGGEFGLGSGEGGGVLGIGDSGIGAAGSGGFGGGLGQRMRVGTAGVWNLNVAANRIAYVVDFSGSIITVVGELKLELKRSVSRLRASQSFNVVLFYGTGGRSQVDSFKPALVSATAESKAALIEWLDQREPSGGTEPFPAVQRALRQDPEAIFFFSDGRFDPDVVDMISDANRRRRAQILCLLFDEAVIADAGGLPPASNAQVQLLQRLAELNKGRSDKGAFKTVTPRDLYGG